MIEDLVPGLLEWHEELRYWRGSLTLASGRTALLDITPATDKQADNPDFPEVFAAAHLIVAWLRASEVETYGIASRAMLKLYNDTWSDEPPISAEELASRIALVNVSMLVTARRSPSGSPMVRWRCLEGTSSKPPSEPITDSGARTWLGEARRRTIRCSRPARQEAFRGSMALQPRQLLSFVVRRFWFSMMRNLVSSLEPSHYPRVIQVHLRLEQQLPLLLLLCRHNKSLQRSHLNPLLSRQRRIARACAQ